MIVVRQHKRNGKTVRSHKRKTKKFPQPQKTGVTMPMTNKWWYGNFGSNADDPLP